jgi:hypothetical protein
MDSISDSLAGGAGNTGIAEGRSRPQEPAHDASLQTAGAEVLRLMKPPGIEAALAANEAANWRRRRNAANRPALVFAVGHRPLPPGDGAGPRLGSTTA